MSLLVLGHQLPAAGLAPAQALERVVHQEGNRLGQSMDQLAAIVGSNGNPEGFGEFAPDQEHRRAPRTDALTSAALRTLDLWKFRRIAPPVDTMQRHPSSAPQVGHCTAADGLLLRRDCCQGSVVAVSLLMSCLLPPQGLTLRVRMVTIIVSLTRNVRTSGNE